MYRKCGYISADASCCAGPDLPHFTLLAEDENGEAVGTVSLVFDSPAGLPCDEVYPAELNAFRAGGRRLVEVTRLAMSADRGRSKLLLVHLFEFIYIYAWYVRRFTDFVIEVNPRHVEFYRRLLPFEEAGPERPCPRVGNAPARLLRLDLAVGQREIARTQDPNVSVPTRTLFAHFHPLEEELSIARFLERSLRAWSKAQAEAPFNRLHPSRRTPQGGTPRALSRG
jgi:hypothetical protein